MRRLHLSVHGLVQGVFYRASARSQAARLGLTGWVRNRPEGSVECVAEGDEARLRSFLVWCREGPPGASVTRVEETLGEATREFDSFRVTY